MALTVTGRELHGNVDPAGTYLRKRDLQALKDVGAVDADQAKVIDRADKIGLGNKNSIAEATEVDRLWSADVHPTLFPNEQRTLGTVWEKFKVQSTDFAAPNVPALNFREVPGNLGAVDPEMPFPIVQLPADLQEIAARVQLTIDRNRNPPTIQYGDILKAMKPENANKYTDEENAQIKNLQQRFLNEILPRVVTPPALEVPELGEHRLSLANEPGIKAELVTQSTLTMHQSQSKHVRSAEVRPGGVTDINSRLVFERKAIGIHVDVPANHKMIVVSDQGERAVGPGPVALPANPGQYILELYDARGTKLGDKSFTVPDVRASHDLSEAHFGKSLRTAAGALEPELVKYDSRPLANQVYGARNFVNGTHHDAEWRLVPQGAANHQGDVNAARAAFTRNAGTLRDGTYTFKTEGMAPGQRPQETTLEKYPGPLFKATVEGQEFWLLPYGPSNYAGAEYNGRELFRSFKNGNVEVSFEPATNTLQIVRWEARTNPHWKHEVKDADFTEARAVQ